MSIRFLWRRGLPVLTAAVVMIAVTPALASAAQSQSVKVNPCGAPTCTGSASFVAGSDSSYTTTVAFDTAATAGAPQSLSLQLASGLLANLSSPTALACLANPSGTDKASCVIGSGSIATAGGPVPFTEYMVAPSSGNVFGIDLNALGLPVPGEVSLSQPNVPGPLVATLTSSLSALPVTPTGITFNVNGTLPDGSAFTRMPTACTPATPTSLTVNYASGTPETTPALPDVSVASTCGSLPYNPQITGSATKDSGDAGAQVVTEITQTAAESPIASATLSVPLTVLQVNFGALGVANTSTPVGSVTAVTPLLPSFLPLTGSVFLTLNASTGAVGLNLVFSSPFPFTLSGVVNSDGSLTFAGIPDLPLTDLKVILSGGPQAAYTAPCTTQSGTLSASFTGQNGATLSGSSPFVVSGCPSSTTTTGGTTGTTTGGTTGTTTSGTTVGSPTVSAVSLGGLAKRKPRVRFILTHGTNGPNITSVSVGMPSGLSFSRMAFHRSRTCKGKGKNRRCTTTLKVKGLSLSGGNVNSAKLSGGQLVIALKQPVSGLSVALKLPLLTESKGLQKQVKKGKVKSLKVTIKVTDAKGGATTLVATGKA